jgi:hypothetical protein
VVLAMPNNGHKIAVKKEMSYEAIDTWELKEVTKNAELNRCSFIQCTRTSKLMDVPVSQENEGEKVCILEASHRFNQRWKIYKAGEVYIIKNFKTNLNLDVEEEKYEQGRKIIQWHSTGAHNQFWKLQEKQKGVYRICCFYEPAYEIGNDGKWLTLHKGEKFTWKF